MTTSLEGPLLAMMTQTITVKTSKSLDNYGQRTFSGSGTTYSCFIEPADTMVYDNQGRLVNATATLYVNSSTITASDEITMPDSTTPLILSVNTYYDESGNIHHQQITIQ